MVELQKPYSAKLLRSGKGLVAWQRLARFRLAAKQILAQTKRPEIDLLVDIGALDGIGMRFWKPIAKRIVSLNRYHAESQQFRSAQPDELIVTGDVSSLPISADCADAVVSLESLHYVAGWEARNNAFRDIRRVLRDDGVFICSIPIEIGIPALVKYTGRKCAGIELSRMTFGVMLQHLFYPCFDLSKHYRGSSVGFDFREFVDHMRTEFDIVRRVRVPLPYPLSTNIMCVCKPKSAPTGRDDPHGKPRESASPPTCQTSTSRPVGE